MSLALQKVLFEFDTPNLERTIHIASKDKGKKESKPLDKIKPGEPLPNPLKGPAPSNKKPVDFDFDSSDKDDFDF